MREEGKKKEKHKGRKRRGRKDVCGGVVEEGVDLENNYI